MGVSAEKCAKYYNLAREDQDSFPMKSYQRSQKAHESGKFENEITPVMIPRGFKVKTSTTVEFDEETANASPINDGGRSLLV
ncbi:hypothetical protein WICANDRAFT_63629 [Wickerhamomyces anomalus NRRL Y-366-8]|uniref:Thiolase N-terminal domain-containing protein n=1 Tax=Wickerhamomyces anomalus (strain ATCC 58044 / CBS 1984 / NCYC 433 / NRRL Y-366-8) TaxID=683960 RepID=A0A1E3P2K9_WICAA|nr:uncharacterized protein WICANDRAFT_63629 [Wickerhamomyces anomalus NRRL Y-366-8]ODQ59132.1 hypothetical protein WICANDRAFT_63629 [Wickerhamomyces anomalus NRRL Y-366-8]